MSNTAAIPDKEARGSGLLFEVSPVFAGTSDRVRNALAADLKACAISREQIAAGLSAAVGRPITVASIDAYVAESKPHRFPAELIPAWCTVTGSTRLLEILCAEAGMWAATQEDRDFAELGRTRLRDEKLTRRLWEKI